MNKMKAKHFDPVVKTSASNGMPARKLSKVVSSFSGCSEVFQQELSSLSHVCPATLIKSDSSYERFLKNTKKMDSLSVEPASQVANNQRKFLPNNDSFIVAIRPIIILAQCFALLPVDGTNTTDATEIKFTWKSLKIFYCLVATIGTAILTGFSIHGVATSSITSKKTMEHTLSILSGYVSAVECTSLSNDTDIMVAYFTYHYPQILRASSFSIWQGILVQFVNILSTFCWNFIDLFLILISIACTDQFRQLNSRLYSIRGKHCFIVKAMPEWWWAEARMDFNRLSTMTRYVDSHISDIVLLSFSTNLYFICIQLLHSFNPMRNAVQTAYFCFSFGFLLVRTAAVSLYAAGIHDESVLPAPVLYSVSSSNYSTEVDRFLTQVTTDNISFTGMKFFSITRSLVLTVAGTIVTYELVLVQFNSVQQAEPSNITKVCEMK
ncbi:gustatory receptor for sugar taste 64f-like isoform X5 [Belonocnema kinseyi]|uniref:gustatory receptor for sugar taste 64f-like isoform X5 n=1 Tax=Belonocnema kinseyi TaxID=2817044 RepID=UPI00143CD5AF|nr:gustatory receptor for sugar taste 64f-like isoform X5 [Belonocnema kinseyi]